MHVLITGSAGFIGYHLARKLCERGDEVTGIDNLNSYYDPELKLARLVQMKSFKNFKFIEMDITHRQDLALLFAREKFDVVVNLAAQAGVRYSITDPGAYVDANVVGFLNVLECCRHSEIENLVFASSSSVFGANESYPFSEDQAVDHPLALYGATKKANEVMAHSYAHLYGLPCTGLRFFTVYGPWGRPDMALFKFTRNLLAGKPIDVYNHGKMLRDFTYIDDIIDGVVCTIDHPATANPDWDPKQPDPASSSKPYRIYNVGRGKPENLLDFIRVLEKETGKKAKMNLLPLQPGDVASTWADTSRLQNEHHYQPKVDIAEGVKQFVDWYQTYYASVKGAPDKLRIN